MTIKALPGDHLALFCDSPGCTFEGPAKHGVTEDELLDLAESKGWNIDRELGLHYCRLTTMHDCEVCGAPTRSGIRRASYSGGQWQSDEPLRWYCDEHWPDPRDR